MGSQPPSLPPSPAFHHYAYTGRHLDWSIAMAHTANTPITAPTNVNNGIATAPTTTRLIAAWTATNIMIPQISYKPQPDPRIDGIRDHPHSNRFIRLFNTGWMRNNPEPWIHCAVQEYWQTGPDGQRYNHEHVHSAHTITSCGSDDANFCSVLPG